MSQKPFLPEEIVDELLYNSDVFTPRTIDTTIDASNASTVSCHYQTSRSEFSEFSTVAKSKSGFPSPSLKIERLSLSQIYSKTSVDERNEHNENVIQSSSIRESPSPNHNLVQDDQNSFAIPIEGLAVLDTSNLSPNLSKAEGVSFKHTYCNSSDDDSYSQCDNNNDTPNEYSVKITKVDLSLSKTLSQNKSLLSSSSSLDPCLINLSPKNEVSLATEELTCNEDINKPFKTNSYDTVRLDKSISNDKFNIISNNFNCLNNNKFNSCSINTINKSSTIENIPYSDVDSPRDRQWSGILRTRSSNHESPSDGMTMDESNHLIEAKTIASYECLPVEQSLNHGHDNISITASITTDSIDGHGLSNDEYQHDQSSDEGSNIEQHNRHSYSSVNAKVGIYPDHYGGLGLFAIDNITAGDLVLSDLPAVACSTDLKDMLERLMSLKPEQLSALVGIPTHEEALSPQDEAEIMSVVASTKDPETLKVFRWFVCLMKCNAHGLCHNQTSWGIYPVGTRANHSCNPNLWYRNINGELQYVAIRDIAKGEQLEMAYSNHLFASRGFRQGNLSKQKMFICQCLRCRREIMGIDPARLVECPICREPSSNERNEIESAYLKSNLPEKLTTLKDLDDGKHDELDSQSISELRLNFSEMKKQITSRITPSHQLVSSQLCSIPSIENSNYFNRSNISSSSQSASFWWKQSQDLHDDEDDDEEHADGQGMFSLFDHSLTTISEKSGEDDDTTLDGELTCDRFNINTQLISNTEKGSPSMVQSYNLSTTTSTKPNRRQHSPFSLLPPTPRSPVQFMASHLAQPVLGVVSQNTTSSVSSANLEQHESMSNPIQDPSAITEKSDMTHCRWYADSNSSSQPIASASLQLPTIDTNCIGLKDIDDEDINKSSSLEDYQISQVSPGLVSCLPSSLGSPIKDSILLMNSTLPYSSSSLLIPFDSNRWICSRCLHIVSESEPPLASEVLLESTYSLLDMDFLQPDKQSWSRKLHYLKTTVRFSLGRFHWLNAGCDYLWSRFFFNAWKDSHSNSSRIQALKRGFRFFEFVENYTPEALSIDVVPWASALMRLTLASNDLPSFIRLASKYLNQLRILHGSDDPHVVLFSSICDYLISYGISSTTIVDSDEYLIETRREEFGCDSKLRVNFNDDSHVLIHYDSRTIKSIRDIKKRIYTIIKLSELIEITQDWKIDSENEPEDKSDGFNELNPKRQKSTVEVKETDLKLESMSCDKIVSNSNSNNEIDISFDTPRSMYPIDQKHQTGGVSFFQHTEESQLEMTKITDKRIKNESEETSRRLIHQRSEKKLRRNSIHHEDNLIPMDKLNTSTPGIVKSNHPENIKNVPELFPPISPLRPENNRKDDACSGHTPSPPAGYVRGKGLRRTSNIDTAIPSSAPATALPILGSIRFIELPQLPQPTAVQLCTSILGREMFPRHSSDDGDILCDEVEIEKSRLHLALISPKLVSVSRLRHKAIQSFRLSPSLDVNGMASIYPFKIGFPRDRQHPTAEVAIQTSPRADRPMEISNNCFNAVVANHEKVEANKSNSVKRRKHDSELKTNEFEIEDVVPRKGTHRVRRGITSKREQEKKNFNIVEQEKKNFNIVEEVAQINQQDLLGKQINKSVGRNEKRPLTPSPKSPEDVPLLAVMSDSGKKATTTQRERKLKANVRPISQIENSQCFVNVESINKKEGHVQSSTSDVKGRKSGRIRDLKSQAVFQNYKRDRKVEKEQICSSNKFPVSLRPSESDVRLPTEKYYKVTPLSLEVGLLGNKKDRGNHNNSFFIDSNVSNIDTSIAGVVEQQENVYKIETHFRPILQGDLSTLRLTGISTTARQSGSTSQASPSAVTRIVSQCSGFENSIEDTYVREQTIIGASHLNFNISYSDGILSGNVYETNNPIKGSQQLGLRNIQTFGKLSNSLTNEYNSNSLISCTIPSGSVPSSTDVTSRVLRFPIAISDQTQNLDTPIPSGRFRWNGPVESSNTDVSLRIDDIPTSLQSVSPAPPPWAVGLPAKPLNPIPDVRQTSKRSAGVDLMSPGSLSRRVLSTSTAGHSASTTGHSTSSTGHFTSTTGHFTSTTGHTTSTTGHATSTTGCSNMSRQYCSWTTDGVGLHLPSITSSCTRRYIQLQPRSQQAHISIPPLVTVPNWTTRRSMPSAPPQQFQQPLLPDFSQPPVTLPAETLITQVNADLSLLQPVQPPLRSSAGPSFPLSTAKSKRLSSRSSRHCIYSHNSPP